MIYFLDMRNLQEQARKAFCYQKLFWPFTIQTNFSIPMISQVFVNSRPSTTNFISSIEQCFPTVRQNNFDNKTAEEKGGKIDGILFIIKRWSVEETFMYFRLRRFTNIFLEHLDLCIHIFVFFYIISCAYLN